MKHLAKLFVTLPFLYCIQFPSVGSLNQTLQAVANHQLTLSHEVITSDGAGGYILFFQSQVGQASVISFLNTYGQDASFCPAS